MVPAIMSLLAMGLAWLLVFSGFGFLDFDQSRYWWLYSGDPETARNLLSTILSGMITMTTLVISITMVVLSLAAGQLGPRLIASFLSDRQIKAVLGLFMATILYTLVVLRSLSDDADTVSHIAVSTSAVLTVICLFALLFFVQKIGRSVIADTVVSQVADDLERAIDGARTASERAGSGRADRIDDARDDIRAYSNRRSVSLHVSGYVQVVDYEQLAAFAADRNALVQLNFRPGTFLLRGGEHLDVFTTGPLAEGFSAKAGKSFVIGWERTATQDLEYSIRQLVEIAVRALSPGINDPRTAILVVHRLGAALERTTQRPPPPNRYRDKKGRVRILARPADFGVLLDESFNLIRQAAAGSAVVLIEMSRVIGNLALIVEGHDDRRALLSHQRKLDRAAHVHLLDPADLADFMAAASPAHSRLAGPARRAFQ